MSFQQNKSSGVDFSQGRKTRQKMGRIQRFKRCAAHESHEFELLRTS